PSLPTAKANKETIDAIDSGQAAGFAVLTLMKLTHGTLEPQTIVEAFKAAKKKNADVVEAMAQFEDETVEVMARGANYLAAIWTAAWKQGKGAQKVANRGKVAAEKLIALYTKRTELPSMHLDTIAS